MVPPKNRAKKKTRPSWEALFTTHYNTKGKFAGTFKVRRVTACDTVEEDSKAGTCICNVSYEYEPCDPSATDCTEYGSEHKEYGEDCRRVEYALKEATGEWAVTKLGDHGSGRAAAASATTDTEDEDRPGPRAGGGRMFSDESEYTDEDEY